MKFLFSALARKQWLLRANYCHANSQLNLCAAALRMRCGPWPCSVVLCAFWVVLVGLLEQ